MFFLRGNKDRLVVKVNFELKNIWIRFIGSHSQYANINVLENYELEVEPVFPDPDSIEVIKFKMEQNNMRNNDLAGMIGGKSKASEILNKKRKLSLKMIRQINIIFGIPAEVLIGDYELENETILLVARLVYFCYLIFHCWLIEVQIN